MSVNIAYSSYKQMISIELYDNYYIICIRKINKYI